MFSCFYPITGGRVSEIVSQESRLRKDTLPRSKNDDKIEKFCETYKGFIDVNDAYERFTDNWEKQKDAAGDTLEQKRRYPLLLRALANSFYGDLLKAVVAKLVWGILVIFSIWYFVFEILAYIKLKKDGTNTKKDDDFALILCGCFFLCMFTLSVGIQQMGIYSSVLGAKVKAALTTSIYKKMIAREGYGSDADVVSLVARDVEKLAEACLSLQYLWSGIFETATVFAVLLSLMGATILPGLGLMAIFLPLQYYLGMIVAYRKKSLAVVSNRRISLMEEILRGIKLIKIYGWEESFFKKLHHIRDEEGALLTIINRYKAAILGLIFCLPPLMCMVIFGTQEATGEIESVVVFTTLSFFNTLRVPFSKLPKSLRDVLDAVACIERIQNFLFEPELAVMESHDKKGSDKDYEGITFHNVTVSYGHGARTVLENVNLDIARGSLMMVAGPVASGKSNLLKSILGHLTVCEGECYVSSSKAYVPQTPWTALGTVRDNILFGNAYDEAFYRKVLHACALERDLEIMDDGDMTWIGERGGNLSGGQKQRIALARAAYSRADLYVLDSPLSAVDMYTCQHIFKYCIQDLMIGGGGTVVLATHQTELFSMSDHLVVLYDGKIMYNEKYTFSGVRHLFPNMAEEGVSTETVDVKKKKENKKTTPTFVYEESKTKVNGPKVYKESIYMWYIKRIGVLLFTVATIIFIIGQIIRVYSDVWISVWTTRKFADDGFTTDAFYAGLYVMLVLVFLSMAFIRAYVWFTVGKDGANNIHDMTFGAALKAPMHFFHVTPIGKLLTFFSKDIDTIDDVLVDNMCMLQIFGWILIMAIGLVATKLLMYLAVVGGLAIVYIYVVWLFIRASVPLKDNSGQALSQVIAHTAETLSGLAVVRAFRMEKRFLHENLDFQARSTVADFAVANLSLWLAFRVDIIGSLLVLACCLLAVLGDGIDPAIAGLIVSNSFQTLLFFSIMSRTMGEIHSNMGAVDHARVMADLEAEHEPAEERQTPPHWPSKGEIKFEGVVMPYLPGKPPVLKGINFTIHEGEKIGVVGRTGAGKSSLIVAMYRLAEISQGRIHVDDIDCSTISLHKLRSSMAIIPQEPVMFAGTLRTNLDPFNLHSDKEIIDVLHKCLLGSMLSASKVGLESKVEFFGANYSLGTNSSSV